MSRNLSPSSVRLEGKLAARLHHAAAAVAKPRRVVALHGWLDNAATFDVLAPRIAQEFEAEVACLDFPGHGASAHRPHSLGVGYSFIDYAASAIAFIDALGWGDDDVHLVRGLPLPWLWGCSGDGAPTCSEIVMYCVCVLVFQKGR